jgi:hypothetical protein
MIDCQFEIYVKGSQPIGSELIASYIFSKREPGQRRDVDRVPIVLMIEKLYAAIHMTCKKSGTQMITTFCALRRHFVRRTLGHTKSVSYALHLIERVYYISVNTINKIIV